MLQKKVQRMNNNQTKLVIPTSFALDSVALCSSVTPCRDSRALQ